MHYIRILRPPALVPASGPGRNSPPSLSLVLTITTDLGDSFLCPDAPIDLVVELHIETEEEEVEEEEKKEDEEQRLPKARSKKLIFRLNTTAVDNAKKNKPAQHTAPAWTAGLRVLKLDAALPSQAVAFWNSDDDKRLCIRAANADISATHARQIIYPADGGNGLIVPLWIDVPDDAVHSDEPFPHVALRRLEVPAAGKYNTAAVEVEEEIGESIARHVWDAGLVTVAFLADACMGLLKPPAPPKSDFRKRAHDGDDSDDPHRKETHASILKHMLRPQMYWVNKDPLRILELGSGVGILGIGLAKIMFEASKADSMVTAFRQATVLLTDLPEAEERARANIELADVGFPKSDYLEYANLDWLDGEKGKFGADLNSKRYDLIMLSDCTYNVDMLPALVGTLTALQAATRQKTQRVLLTKKTRHQSEELLFDLLKDAGWRMLCGGAHAVRLPVLDGDEQTIEVFLFERTV